MSKPPSSGDIEWCPRLPTPELAGVVEIDETYFHESEKGERPDRAPQTEKARGQPRRRCDSTTGHDYGRPRRRNRLGKPTTYIDSSTGDDESDDRPRLRGGHRQSSNLSRGAPLESTRQALNLSKGERSRGIWHLNTVNNRHSVMKSKLNHYHRGVSSKYLDNYMNLACTPGIQARQVCGTELHRRSHGANQHLSGRA